MKRTLLLVVVMLMFTGYVQAQTKSSQKAENLVSFGNGYCKIEEGSLLLDIGPDTLFDAYVETVKGQPMQRARLVKENSISKGTVRVQILSKSKEPLGAPRDLNLSASKWNEKSKTIDLTFTDETMRLLLHTTTNLRGFSVEGFECTPVTPAKSKP